MNINIKDIDIIEIADKLSNASDDEQALFFNTFSKALLVNCETHFRRDMQLANIYAKLNSETKRDMLHLAED